MPGTPGESKWLNRFAWLLSGLTLFLICSGGMVTSKGVGLAVPDWPTTFGYNMFLFPISQWIGGVFFEHTHRLIASVIGILTIVLAVWLWRAETRRWMRILGVVALGSVILQGVLGGLRVTLLKDEIGIFHACLAQAFFGLLVFIALATSEHWIQANASSLEGAAVWLPIITVALIYLQLGLGATMRHQHRDLAIFDFPAAYGRVIPDVSAEALARVNSWRDARAFSEVTAAQIWLQMVHRFVALLIAGGVVGSWFLLSRSRGFATETSVVLSRWWIFFLAVQITLGAWVIWSNKAADIATAHVAVGATMLALGVAISALGLRSRGSIHHRTQESQMTYAQAQ
ncbi:MAG TPA: COX15/CtaA family protein [Chthoniobacterales bacterium]|nr:COX15/CtaA family protein [Chthoniobacterales bacterium]